MTRAAVAVFATEDFAHELHVEREVAVGESVQGRFGLLLLILVCNKNPTLKRASIVNGEKLMQNTKKV